MKTKKTLALLLILAIVFTLAACGGGTSSTPTASTSKPSVSEGSPSGSTLGTPAVAEPVTTGVTNLDLGSAASINSAQKDVINVGIPADVANFSPWSFSGAGANQALMSLYQPLLHHENGEYYSAIAKANFKIADDGMSCDFEIFDNIYDSEGNHITVDDVIFSFTKVGEVRPQYAKLIPSIDKTGDYTCTFNFSHALKLGDFDSFARIFIVSEKAFNDSQDAMATTPVGTGHYKMTSYTSGYSMTYERVENYWQNDINEICVRDMANVAKINFYVISESAQRSMALDNGTIDICMSITAEDLPKYDDKNGYQIASISSNDTITMFCNCDESKLTNDLNLRLAISYAVSGEAVLRGVLNGDGVVCHELSPSYAAGYNPEWDTEDNYYNYDATKAAEYLAKSKYNKETLVIICEANENSKTTAELVLNFLKQVNINATIEAYEATVFEQYIQDPSKWDIMITDTQYNIFYVEGVFGSYDNSRYASGGGINFVYDDTLQELLSNCMDLSTYTAENIDLLHDHIIANCYAKSLAASVDQFVVPDCITGLALNYRGFLLPGACSYS